MNVVLALFPYVRRLSWRVVHPRMTDTDREDLVQEGAVGLLEAAARYDPGHGCALKTYGGKRAAGAMMDHARRLASRSAHEADLDGPGLDAVARNDTRSPESRVLLARFRRFLATGWESLQGRERAVLRMRYFDGLSIRDVAGRMGVSVATIVRLEQRAIDCLRGEFLERQRQV